jgi:hypothetical protein
LSILLRVFNFTPEDLFAKAKAGWLAGWLAASSKMRISTASVRDSRSLNYQATKIHMEFND